MTPPILPHTMPAPPVPPVLPIPRYLEQVYWWAYVHPRAVHLFEREWLINLILFGNYRRLCNLCLAGLGDPIAGKTVQLACVYGDLSTRLVQRLAPQARLEIVDILPIQLDNLARKLPADPRVTLRLADTSRLPHASASVDQVLLFFLLHEQPESVRRATLAEALRVVKPGGRIVIVDYGQPISWHPLRPILWLVFRALEPYALDLWRGEIAAALPPDLTPASLCKSSYLGGLYQRLILTR
jgi:SAM-dependent methyltransferase